MEFSADRQKDTLRTIVIRFGGGGEEEDEEEEEVVVAPATTTTTSTAGRTEHGVLGPFARCSSSSREGGGGGGGIEGYRVAEWRFPA